MNTLIPSGIPSLSVAGKPSVASKASSGEGSPQAQSTPADAEVDVSAQKIVVQQQERIAGVETVNEEAEDQRSTHSKEVDSIRSEIAAEITKAAESVDRTGIRVSAEVHEPTGRYVLQIREGDTGEILREFPPEELLDVVATLDDLSGLLVEGEL